MEMIEVLLLMAVAAALLLWVLAARRLERRYDSLRDEVGALWRRIEWLCRDTDDRLSVNRWSSSRNPSRCATCGPGCATWRRRSTSSRPTRSRIMRRTANEYDYEKVGLRQIRRTLRLLR